MPPPVEFIDLRSDSSMRQTCLPAAVKDAINAAPLKDLFNVGPNEQISGSVLKAQSIQFSPGATMWLEHINDASPDKFFALVADEFLFALPFQSASIRFKGVASRDGSDGSPGKPGKKLKRRGRDDHHGEHGAKGGPGGDATDGGETKLATIYILTNRLVPEQPPRNETFFTFQIQGIPGGRGGHGGRGADGRSGGKGKKGVIDKDLLGRPKGCKRGGGNGGNGGDGGQGGKPGNGGKGGDGGDLVYIGPPPAIVSLGFANAFNGPGEAGVAGMSGESGDGGKVGARGGADGVFCKGHGNAGDHPGQKPPRTEPLAGIPGDVGRKGETKRCIVADYRDVLV